MRVILALVCFAFILFSCRSKTTAQSTSRDQKTSTVNIDSLPKVKINPRISPPKADYTIDTVYVTGQVLTIKVSYSGGCQEHGFFLVSDGELLKSNPPKIYAYLFHQSNGDACRELVTKELKFNIEPLKTVYAGKYELVFNFKHKFIVR